MYIQIYTINKFKYHKLLFINDKFLHFDKLLVSPFPSSFDIKLFLFLFYYIQPLFSNISINKLTIKIK